MYAFHLCADPDGILRSERLFWRSSGLSDPRLFVPDDCVEDDEELSGFCDQRHLRCFRPIVRGGRLLFEQRFISANEPTAGWTIVFSFASAAASSAYLTVSEMFPVEIRAMSIAAFYAVGTGVGGVFSP